jgi:predicted phosphodiesterase
MKILCLSDLHFGKESWGDMGREAAQRAIDMSKSRRFDVFLFNGDLAEPGPDGDDYLHFREGMELLNQIEAPVKLFVCGNNDFELLHGPFEHYPEQLEHLVGHGQLPPVAGDLTPCYHGFSVLDRCPFLVGDVAFVGSMGWANGWLWKESDREYPDSGQWPATYLEIREAYEKYWREHLGFENGDYLDLYGFCQQRLKGDIAAVATRASRIVVCTHFVPSPKFCKYGHSAKFDYLNWYMGYDAERDTWPYRHFEHPKVVMGLTGHTHRNKTVEVCGVPVHNVSSCSGEQPVVLEVPKVVEKRRWAGAM